MVMREIIAIGIGQGGVQISNAVWELFCTEHGILANGLLKEYLRDEDSSAFKTVFQECLGNQYVPRSVFIDLEPTVLDEIRTGPYRNLFHPEQLISYYEDAANNYARGHFTLGKNIIDSTVDRIRKVADVCEMLQGFIIINSIGGGTGSGLSSLVIEKLAVEFTKRMKLQIVVMPSSNLDSAIVYPYNTVLSMIGSSDHAEISCMFDNEAVFKICQDSLDLKRPTFNNLNRVISQVVSSLTVSLRYENFLNSDLDQLNTNLVPYPRIHFPVFNYAPLVSSRKAEHENMTVSQLTRALFESKTQMLGCNMIEGRYMSCCLQFRGDVTPIEVNSSIFEIKRRTDIKFVSWCPTGFKIGINCQPPVSIPGSEIAPLTRSVMMMTNTTAVCQSWENFSRKFDILFSKRSFVHWYVGEGMEEGEFNEAKDEMTSLIQDYMEVAQEDEEEEEDEPANISSVPEPAGEKDENGGGEEQADPTTDAEEAGDDGKPPESEEAATEDEEGAEVEDGEDEDEETNTEEEDDDQEVENETEEAEVEDEMEQSLETEQSEGEEDQPEIDEYEEDLEINELNDMF